MIREASDCYNPYDPTQTRIKDGVYQYLRSYCTELHYRDHLHDTLRICTDGPVDADRFRTALLDAVQEDRSEFDRMLAENKRRVIWEYIVGILLSLLGVGLSIVLDQVLLAIISFLGSMAISDAVTIQTKVNHDIKRLRNLLEPFSDFKLEVVQKSE
jgi:hypothetical protein